MWCLKNSFLFRVLVVCACTFMFTCTKRFGNMKTCPPKCTCKPRTNSNEELNAIKRRGIFRSSVNITACQREWLENVPQGVPQRTTDLYLEQNWITHLNSSHFSNNSNLQAIVLAHNKISRISPDTFLNMKDLIYLDLSRNNLQVIPEGLFCPWTPPAYEIPCSIEPSNTSRRILSVLLGGNSWICTCALQTFIQNYSCDYVARKNFDVCLQLEATSQTSDIGYCDTPKFTVHIPINRLSAEADKTGFGRLMVNTCLNQKSKIDFALLLVMFTWIGATIAYVIHFVSWNNKEIARHKNYISSLEACKAAQENFEQRRHHETPGLSVNDKVVEEPRLLSTSQAPVSRNTETTARKSQNPRNKP